MQSIEGSGSPLQYSVGGMPEGKILHFYGRLDFYNSHVLLEVLEAQKERGELYLLIDLLSVESVDATATSVLISLNKKINDSSGKMVVVCRDNLARNFAVTGLDKVFLTGGTIGDGRKKLREAQSGACRP